MIDPAAWLKTLSDSLSPRDYRLLERAAATLTGNILQPGAGLVLPWSPFQGIIPSHGAYRGIWNWDAAFHAIGVAHWDPDLARDQVRILLEAQLPSGALPDVIFEDGRVVKTFGKPPVMPWAAAWVDCIAPDDAFTAYVYPKFTAYEKFWREFRQVDGLFHYDAAEDTPLKSDEHARLESGWDNSVRWDQGARFLWAVDLNSYMVMLYRALAYFAWRLNLPADKGLFEARAGQLSARINGRLFDEQRGAYLDRNYETDQFSPVFSPAMFTPLYAQVVPPERAQQVVQMGRDPAKFFPGMPTVAYDDPAFESSRYWRGPCWLNTAYFAAKGMKDAGCVEDAGTIRDTILNWCAQNKDALYEYYDSRSGQGLGAKNFGWTAAFVICFILDWNGGLESTSLLTRRNL